MADEFPFFAEEDMIDCDKIRDGSKRAATENSKLCSENCTVDPVTQEEIPATHIIWMKFGESLQCYNVESLYKHLQEKNVDPLTRKRYTQLQLNKISEKYRSVLNITEEQAPNLNVDQYTHMTWEEKSRAMNMNMEGQTLDEDHSPLGELRKNYMSFHGDNLKNYKGCNFLFDMPAAINDKQAEQIYMSTIFQDLVFQKVSLSTRPNSWFRMKLVRANANNFFLPQLYMEEKAPPQAQRNRIFLNSLPVIYDHCYKLFQQENNVWPEYIFSMLCRTYSCIINETTNFETLLGDCLPKLEQEIQIVYRKGIARLWQVYNSLYNRLTLPYSYLIEKFGYESYPYTKKDEIVDVYQFMTRGQYIQPSKANAEAAINMLTHDDYDPILALNSLIVQDLFITGRFENVDSYFSKSDLHRGSLTYNVYRKRLDGQIDVRQFVNYFQDCKKFFRMREFPPQSLPIHLIFITDQFFNLLFSYLSERGINHIHMAMREATSEVSQKNVEYFEYKARLHQQLRRLVYVYHLVYGTPIVPVVGSIGEYHEDEQLSSIL